MEDKSRKKWYEDDSTLIVKSVKEMAELLNRVVEKSAKMGLQLNFTKTNMMVIGQIVNKSYKINGESSNKFSI